MGRGVSWFQQASATSIPDNVESTVILDTTTVNTLNVTLTSGTLVPPEGVYTFQFRVVVTVASGVFGNVTMTLTKDNVAIESFATSLDDPDLSLYTAPLSSFAYSQATGSSVYRLRVKCDTNDGSSATVKGSVMVQPV